MRRVARSSDIPTVTLNLGEGDWVKLKTHFTLADREAINGAIVEGMIKSDEDGGMGLGRLNLGASNTATLLRAIVEWGGPGFCVKAHEVTKGAGDEWVSEPVHDTDSPKSDCKVLNLTPENIRNLDENTAQLMLNELLRRNPQVGESTVSGPVSNGSNGTGNVVPLARGKSTK